MLHYGVELFAAVFDPAVILLDFSELLLRHLAFGFKLVQLKGEGLALFAFLLVFEINFVFFLSEAGVVFFKVLAAAVLVLQFLDLLVLLLHFLLEFVEFSLDVLMLEQRFFDGSIGYLVLFVGACEFSLALVEFIDHGHISLESQLILLDRLALLEQRIIALLPIRYLPF